MRGNCHRQGADQKQCCFNNAEQRTKFVTYAILMSLRQALQILRGFQNEKNPEPPMQDTDMAAYVDRLEAGDFIQRWDVIHSDETTTIAVHFQD